MTRVCPSVAWRRVWVVVALVVAWGTAGLFDVLAAPFQTSPEIGRPGKDVMWVPSPDMLVGTMLDIADVTAQDVVMDLGSGDGRTVIAAAELGARAVGVEYDPELVELSRVRATEAGVADRTTFVAADLFEVDLSSATVITMFLLPELNLRLRPRLLALAPGTRIVSNTWDFEDWVADETAVLDPCPGFCTALLWIVPANVEGTWHLADGELALAQQYQVVTGTLRVGVEQLEIEDGRMRGEQISFRVGDTHYSGHVSDGAMSGVAVTGARTVTWQARWGGR